MFLCRYLFLVYFLVLREICVVCVLGVGGWPCTLGNVTGISEKVLITLDFCGGLVVNNLPVSAGDPDSIPGSGRCPGEGNDDPLQYPCLGNPMDRRSLVG